MESEEGKIKRKMGKIKQNKEKITKRKKIQEIEIN